MFFGPVPVADAAGCILAHALNRLSFKKGRVLSADDVRAIHASGITMVTVARLEPGDVGEDRAAARVAAALKGPGLTASAAFTGRVNLFADADGLLVLGREGIDRLNRVDEAVTVATLPPFAPVKAGQMVATVKIIPFAVPEPVISETERLAGRTGTLLTLAPWRGSRAGLVQTLLPGLKPSAQEKAFTVTAGRLAGVGGRLLMERRVPHEPEAVACALADLRRAGCDLLLVIGASAITDRRDVLPAGIALAGGEVLHFGMPVDPGNLLLLASLEGVPVLGLPGCARSPKFNGFDWVLQRLAAGLPVTPDHVTGLGVGGLLAEIPTRPLPRAAATEPARAPRIAALVLAAGRSRRLGRNKLLEPLNGAPLITHAVDAALASQAAQVLVVTGHEAERVEKALSGRPVMFVHAAEHDAGQSATLKAGLAALPAELDGVVVLLGDMPLVTSTVVDRLIAAYAPAEGRTICVPTHDGRRGNPVLWDRRFVPAMLELEGDVGAKELLRRHGEHVVEVAMPDDGILLDADTEAALALLEQRQFDQTVSGEQGFDPWDRQPAPTSAAAPGPACRDG